MNGLDRNALDRYITGGRYSALPMIVTCPCGEQVGVLAETEYGATTWQPEECPKCGRAFEGDEPWEEDGPDEDAAYDAWREEQDAP